MDIRKVKPLNRKPYMKKRLADFSEEDADWLKRRARPLEWKEVKRPNGDVVEIIAGICPCDCHFGEIMHKCDPDSDPKGIGCQCCSDLCT